MIRKQQSKSNMSEEKVIPGGLSLSRLMDIWWNHQKFDSNLIAPLPEPCSDDPHVPENRSIKCNDIFNLFNVDEKQFRICR